MHFSSEISASLGEKKTHSRRVIALLGRPDQPTDGVRDYCEQLRKALLRRGVTLEVKEVTWQQNGYAKALVELWFQSKWWRGTCILLQYTALSWSRHGFPFAVPAVLWLLRRRGAQCTVIFHDSRGFYGDRAIDRLRRACQHWTMRQAHSAANRSVLTTPLDQIPWLSRNSAKAVFVPIGANIPEIENRVEQPPQDAGRPKTVAVFVVSGGSGTNREVADVAYAVRYASARHRNLRLVVLGRNSLEADAALRSALVGSEVALTTLGVIPASEISSALSGADVLLFVRGPVASTRGSAIAGIACGLPIVGYGGPETGFPISEAGLELAPYGDRDKLAAALDHVLADEGLRKNLSSRSFRAYQAYFSWDKIAERFAMELLDG